MKDIVEALLENYHGVVGFVYKGETVDFPTHIMMEMLTRAGLTMKQIIVKGRMDFNKHRQLLVTHFDNVVQLLNDSSAETGFYIQVFPEVHIVGAVMPTVHYTVQKMSKIANLQPHHLDALSL